MQNKQTRLASLLSAGVLILGVPAVALAQQTPPVQQTGQATVGNLIAALNNITVQVNNLQALNDLTVQDVRVVNVEDVLNNNNVNALNNALNNNKVEILNLRDVLSKNDVITDALNNNNVEIGNVVAIDVLSGGDVVVFAQ